MHMNIAFISLGCAKNLVDTEIMLSILKKKGYKIVQSEEKADIFIVNTCAFINEAKEEAIDTILEKAKLKEKTGLKYLIATGCLSQKYGDDLLKEIPELDAVVGISSFKRIDEVLNDVINGKRVELRTIPSNVFFEEGDRLLTTPSGSAYLKIAEGCSNNCSYCAIPSIRGIMRSRPFNNILSESIELIDKGIKELTIIAQDTAKYGSDFTPQDDLHTLINSIAEHPGDFWIRLMYLHPAHIKDELIDLVSKQSKVLPYLDIPIQHASDKILKSMNRKHSHLELINLFKKIKSKIPDIVLRTTVMLGYPGENEDDFKILCDFIEEIEFDCLGAFEYTAEEGTPAASLGNQIDEDIKLLRKEKILEIQKEISRKKNIKRINQEEKILITTQHSKNLYIGRAYFQAAEVDGVTIIKSSKKIPKGDFIIAKLKGIRDYDMIGEYENESTK